MSAQPAVIIVGGGIAGLATAYELHRQQVPFVLLEAGARVGGVVFSERVDDFVVDGGPDSLLIQKPEGIALCRELGLGDRLVPTLPPRLAYIQRDGRLHALPEGSVLGVPTKWGPFVRSQLFSWSGKLRMGAELFVPPRHDAGDESIGAFMTRRFGREATEYIAEPLLAGIHAGDVHRLSIRALFPRFTDAEARYGSLLKAFRAQPRPAAASDGVFRSLPGGLSEMIEAVVATLPPEALRLRTAATRIDRDGLHYRVDTSSGDRFSAPALVLAAPAFAAAPLLSALSPDLSRLCGEIRYASAVTVALAFAREAVGDPLLGSGFVVPKAERSGITAGAWLSSKWPHRAPAGRVLMRAFVTDTRDPRALEYSDAELVKIGLDAFTPLLKISGAPLFTRIYRWPRANAQHEVGHLEHMAAIEQALTTHPGLYLTGSAYRGAGIPDCVSDGRATARQIAAARRETAAISLVS